MMKKFFAILMIVTMVVCYMPTVAFADSGNTQEPPTNATGDDCVEQENPDYSTLINDCDFTFYCTPGGGKIEEVYWDKDILESKIFPMAAPPLVEGGYCKFKATPSKGWVFNEWKHEISRDAYEVLGERTEEWRAENTSWTITKLEGLKLVDYTRYAFSPNGSEIELRRGPSKYETKWAKLHYVVHAHFNPTITVEYDDSSWSVTDGGNKVANDVPVEVQYKTDKTFGIQTVDGKTAKIEVVDVGENPVNTGYTKNQDGSITFNKVSQPLKLKVTFEDVELPPAPEECDASFFIKPDGVGAPNDPNGVFPENEFLPNGEAHKGLKGEVYGTATGNDAVKKAIKSEPKREDIINVIKDAYQLDAQEELAVKFRWYVIKSVNDGCNYHVDGVPVLDKDTENERVLKRYKITYQDDAGKVLYSTRANAGEDIPGYVGDTPTKDGYKFAGWESSSEDGKVHGHLTLTPKWEDNGNGGNTGGNGGNNGGNTGGNGGNNGGNTGGNGGQLPPDQNLEDPDNNGNGGNGNGEGGNGNGGNGGDSQKPLPGDKELANDKTNTGTNVPKTGDTGMNALVLNLMLLSISAMAGAVLCIRRKITKR